MAIVDTLKLALDIYLYYQLNNLLICFAETRTQSNLRPKQPWFLHILIGLMISIQLLHFVISWLRVTPLSKKFEVRIAIVLLEEFFFAIIDLIIFLSLISFFTQASLFTTSKGLDNLKTSSVNARKFYVRNSYLLSRNAEEQIKSLKSLASAASKKEEDEETNDDETERGTMAFQEELKEGEDPAFFKKISSATAPEDQ
jgi:hypothetical protein